MVFSAVGVRTCELKAASIHGMCVIGQDDARDSDIAKYLQMVIS